MHVDRLFDVGLYLIEELARSPLFPVPRGGGWMEHHWALAGVKVPLLVCGLIQIQAAGEHATGYSSNHYNNLKRLFTTYN